MRRILFCGKISVAKKILNNVIINQLGELKMPNFFIVKISGWIYRGWKISYDSRAPVTGKFSAIKYGVSMCANTKEMLYSMIDQRAMEKYLNVR